VTSQRLFTAGVHGSASTWVFNLVRELLTARFGAATAARRSGGSR
jgi:hypothetical protein